MHAVMLVSKRLSFHLSQIATCFYIVIAGNYNVTIELLLCASIVWCDHDRESFKPGDCRVINDQGAENYRKDKPPNIVHTRSAIITCNLLFRERDLNRSPTPKLARRLLNDEGKS